MCRWAVTLLRHVNDELGTNSIGYNGLRTTSTSYRFTLTKCYWNVLKFHSTPGRAQVVLTCLKQGNRKEKKLFFQFYSIPLPLPGLVTLSQYRKRRADLIFKHKYICLHSIYYRGFTSNYPQSFEWLFSVIFHAIYFPWQDCRVPRMGKLLHVLSSSETEEWVLFR